VFFVWWPLALPFTLLCLTFWRMTSSEGEDEQAGLFWRIVSKGGGRNSNGEDRARREEISAKGEGVTAHLTGEGGSDKDGREGDEDGGEGGAEDERFREDGYEGGEEGEAERLKSLR